MSWFSSKYNETESGASVYAEAPFFVIWTGICVQNADMGHVSISIYDIHISILYKNKRKNMAEKFMEKLCKYAIIYSVKSIPKPACG